LNNGDLVMSSEVKTFHSIERSHGSFMVVT